MAVMIYVIIGGPCPLIRSDGMNAAHPRARPPLSGTPARRRGSRQWEQRQTRFEQAGRMHGDRVSSRGIAEVLRINYQTVRFDACVCPDWQPGRRPSRLDLFEGHSRGRIAEGCGNVCQIIRELHKNGIRRRQDHGPAARPVFESRIRSRSGTTGRAAHRGRLPRTIHVGTRAFVM
jgi:hypothetical protein